jgi:chaperonin GroES
MAPAAKSKSKSKVNIQPLADRVVVRPLELEVGQKVLYGKYSGTEVTLDDEQYLIVKETDVLAVIN